jgi:hypothetical protein
MVIKPKNQNHTNSSLNRKGAISFLFSKMTLLIFVIGIVISLSYFLSMEKNINKLNKIAKESQSISNVIDSIAATPFNVWVKFNGKEGMYLIKNKDRFAISYKKTELPLATTFPINISKSDAKIELSCVNISKDDTVVLKQCQ